MMTEHDAIAAFADAMRAAGIEPPAKIIADSKLHRFPTNGRRDDDAGWLVLFLDGIPAGRFGDFRRNIDQTWCARSADGLTPAEREAHRRRIEAAKREAEAERAREHREAAKLAKLLWDTADPASGDHPYLTRKCVKPTSMLWELSAAAIKSLAGYAPKAKGEELTGRVLIVPVVVSGGISTVAMIDEAGRKAFLAGGAVAGGYWATGKLPEGDGEGATIPIAEGVATALSASEATGQIAAAALSAGNIPAAARALRERFPKARLIMLADLDQSGGGLAKATEAVRAVGGLVAVPDFGETRPEGAKDFNDMAAHRGLETVRAAIEAAREPEHDVAAPNPQVSAPPKGEPAASGDDAEIAHLAKLSPLAYEREREPAAERLGCRVAILDRLVQGARGESAAPGQGRPLELPEPEPWSEPVDGTALLDGMVAAVKRYMVLDPGAAECIALWVLHTYALDAFGISPRLAITSPRVGCGKTTLLDVLSHLVPRPLLAANISSAAVYRTVEVAQPVLLMDEGDTWLGNGRGNGRGNASSSDELRGVLNSGHRKGSSVVRIVGDNLEPCKFSTWSACAIAMIGTLPLSLADRAIPVALKRKRPDETVEQFRFDRTADLDELARKAARWTKDTLARMRGMDPLVPESLSNRAADNWRVLLAVADCAGGAWPQRTREIAAATVDADQARRTILLADIRDVFAAKGLDQISSAELVAALVEIEGHDWAEYRHGRPLTANTLARLLAADGIRPGTIRLKDGATPKGYRLEQFADAFERYLPPIPLNQTATPPQGAENLAFPGFFDPQQPKPCGGLKSPGNPSNSAGCGVVAVENGGIGDEGAEEGVEEGVEEVSEEAGEWTE